jgi:hypothetical protein
VLLAVKIVNHRPLWIPPKIVVAIVGVTNYLIGLLIAMLKKFEADMAQSIRAEITSPSNVGHAIDSAKIVCPGVGQVKAGKEKERNRRLIVLLVMLSKRMKAMRKRGRLGNNYLVFLRMRQKIEISKV